VAPARAWRHLAVIDPLDLSPPTAAAFRRTDDDDDDADELLLDTT